MCRVCPADCFGSSMEEGLGDPAQEFPEDVPQDPESHRDIDRKGELDELISEKHAAL